MVLESMLNPKKAADKPLHVLIISFFYSFIAIFFAYQLFPLQSSILAIALITILFIPFFQRLFEIEEKKEDLVAEGEIKDNIFTRHQQLIITFGAFFMGVVLAMSFAFVFFPNFQDVFYLQTATLKSFATSSTTGFAAGAEDFGKYVVNNTQVMILMFILSTMFGAGAIFILAWNASVIAVYVGLVARSYAVNFGLVPGFLIGLPSGLLGIALHGIPEIAAYFVAGVAGGILSVGIIRENIMSKEFKQIFKDALVYMAIAEILIVVAALLEAFI
jgi:uncharacterized membrane protein SpoIIM required for sporulation